MPETAEPGSHSGPGSSLSRTDSSLSRTNSSLSRTNSRGSVFLTGATGFVGRRIQTRLLDAGWKLRVLARSTSSRFEFLDPRAEVVDGRLSDAQALARGLVGTCAVINCVGSVRGLNSAHFQAANVDGVRTLCEAIDRQSVQPALLHISSLVAGQPQLSDYAMSKSEGERVIESFSGLNWCVLRPPAVYGPGDVELKSTFAWARRGLVPVPGGDRSQHLSFLHVDDLVSAAEAWLLDPERYRHRVFELHDGHEGGYDWTAIADAIANRKVLYLSLPVGLLNAFARLNEAIARRTGRAIMLSQGKVRELTHSSWVCDNAAFTQASDWQPRISLAAGVKGLFES